MDHTQERHIRLYFDISIFIKGAISAAEIVVGVLAFFIPVSVITDFVMRYAQGELGEDPNDFVATHLVQIAQQFSVTSGVFIAFYLITRGLIKLLLIIALYKNQLWAYPSSLVVIGLFVLYQVYQIFLTHSLIIIILTIFDLIVMYFIWREYQIVKGHLV
jgi:uncharacterized membrane protein